MHRAKHAVMRDMAGEMCKTERRGFYGAHLMTIWTLDLPTEKTASVAMLWNLSTTRRCGHSTSGKARDKIFYIADNKR